MEEISGGRRNRIFCHGPYLELFAPPRAGSDGSDASYGNRVRRGTLGGEMAQTGSRSLPRRVGRVAAGLLLLAVLAFVVWASLARTATPGPLEAAVDDPAVEVELGSVVTLRPSASDPERGVVFYPGARVHREAYVATWAPIAAETDTLVLIPRMPLNLAVFGRSRADTLIAEHDEPDEWWVGGHSLGGAMAASWLGTEPETDVAGLLLWASFATDGAELAEREDLHVLSVSGERDGLATPDDIAERRSLLPEGAVMVEVEGMNHAQFGRYGAQRGDLTPTISDQQATRALTDAHVEVFADR